MSEIDAMQGRIMAALDRIGQGLDALGPQGAPGPSDELEALRAQLEDEKLANAQLKERVKQLGARVKEAEERADAAVSDAQSASRAGALRSLDADLQALRHANQQLRDNNAALREANATGVVEPHLINKAMMAELEGLRAARAADRAEVEAVLKELDRLVASAGESGAAGDAPQKEES
ncbi:hypothetical protein D6850_05470 [Roseovarius spongiae]|uniref:Colicin transporter n=1 Tax=Roseovarius spongiae TaxID=2320272 RepID=A0A3A8AYD8_9RHOB|nr:hypothetical protein [Roseovarius spongiae]RKF16977.1 hypothetical protein D6850_05470 [Roseovarius spongiae]